MTEIEKLEKLNQMILLDREALFYDIGSSCAEFMMGVDDTNEEELKSVGESWYLANVRFIRQKICSQEVVVNYSKNLSENSKVQIALFILDAVAQKWTFLPAFSVTSLILKEGIDVFCKKE